MLLYHKHFKEKVVFLNCTVSFDEIAIRQVCETGRLISWHKFLMSIKLIIHRADFPTMSHVASGDFTSFVSTPTNPISLPKPTVGLSGGYLKADHKYFAFVHTKFLFFFF